MTRVPTGDDGNRPLPEAFLAHLPDDDTVLCCDASFLVPVPPGAEDSPLGAAGGQGGHVVTWHPERGARVVGVDGRDWPAAMTAGWSTRW